MPTYRYQCDACGHEMELFQSMSDAPKRKCPSCGKAKLQRLIGAGAGVIFKGSGFYQTDYRSSSYSDGEKQDSGPSDKSGTSGKSETSGADKPSGPTSSDTGDAGSGSSGAPGSAKESGGSSSKHGRSDKKKS